MLQDAEPLASGSALYCFGVASRDLVVALPPEVAPRLRLVVAEDLAAIVEVVPVGDFVGEAAEARMDAEWALTRLKRHEDVLRWAMAEAAVLPSRFATLFSTSERVREWLCAEREALADGLRQVSGREEWRVRCTVDREATVRRVRAALEAERPLPAAAGARYLAERRLEAETAARVEREVATITRELFAALCASAVDVREHAAPPVGGADPTLVWSFLVEPSRAPALTGTALGYAERSRAHAVRLEVSGPFPPYGFTPRSAGGRQG